MGDRLRAQIKGEVGGTCIGTLSGWAEPKGSRHGSVSQPRSPPSPGLITALLGPQCQHSPYYTGGGAMEQRRGDLSRSYNKMDRIRGSQ